MKAFRTTKLAAAIGTAALASALSLPANAAIVLGGDNGWEVSYGGFINLFYTQSDWQGGESSSHLQEGLLPNFHTLTAKSPEVGGLKGTAQITFAVDSSANKDGRLDKNGVFGTGSQIDMREVFFNVGGDFGTVSAGRTLSLFQRQAILKDMTLFGVGAMGGPDGAGTALGRIGFGYVYPDFRTRFSYKTNDINGFNLELGIFDPQEPIGGAATAETDTPQFQAEATYTTGFEGGSFNAWVGMIWQQEDITVPGVAATPAGFAFNPATGLPVAVAATPGSNGYTSSIESVGFNIGADVKMGSFNVVGSYYDGSALGEALFNPGGGNGFACAVLPAPSTGSCKEARADGYYVQGSYTFNGKTKLGFSYGESNQDANAAGAAKFRNELWTVGVYHDVNSWLKLVAEYNNQNSNQFGDADIFDVGGFVLW